jgi:sugar phosphate permease
MSSATQPVTHGTHPPLSLSWGVWSIAALFYLAAFYVRASPAVMTNELMSAFQIGAVELGNLASFYYYAYVVMQIPTGVLVDSWGARKLLLAGSIAVALGVVVFGSTDNFYVACAGRAIVGGATAVGWVVTLKIATHWFPVRIFGMISGLGLAIGNIGALVAQVPLRLLVEAMGWREVVIGSAGLALLIGLAAFLLVHNDPTDKGYQTYAPAALQQRKGEKVGELLRGFGRIFAFRNTRLIFLAQGGIVGSILTFTGLWGVPFLRARFGLTTSEAAGVSSVMIVCWAVASPVGGYLSDRMGRRKPVYLGGALLATIGWALLFYAPLPLPAWIAVAAMTSVGCGGVVLGFAYAKESVPARFLGTISGTINIGNMVGPLILQPAIGWILDRNWSGGLENGARVYSAEAFQLAFALVIGWLLITCTLISMTKETHNQQSA